MNTKAADVVTFIVFGILLPIAVLSTIIFLFSPISVLNDDGANAFEIPEPYYTAAHNPDLTFEDLNRTIQEVEIRHEYEKNIFDCSESAAYTEWFLQNKGFDTVIVTNTLPMGRHAYVMVRLKNNSVYLIECSPGNIHFYSNSSYYAFIHYNGKFEDIYEATDSWFSEWDWWNEIS